MLMLLFVTANITLYFEIKNKYKNISSDVK